MLLLLLAIVVIDITIGQISNPIQGCIQEADSTRFARPWLVVIVAVFFCVGAVAAAVAAAVVAAAVAAAVVAAVFSIVAKL